MENISVKDKIKVFEEKIKAKKEELSYLKKNIHVDQVYADERVDINDKTKDDENNEEDEQENYAESI